MQLLYPDTDAQQVESAPDGPLSFLLSSKCNANRTSLLHLSPLPAGEPVGVANNLEALVKGGDLRLKDLKGLISREGGGHVVQNNIVPWLDGEGFLEVGEGLLDVLVLQEVLSSKG